jgi:NHL repeat/6-bladed beta-propeller
MKKVVFLYCTILLFGHMSLQAQITNKPDSTTSVALTFVRWVAEFPGNKDVDAKKGFLGRVGEFVFGKKPIVLINPIAITAKSPNRYWVLDQKTNTISLINEQKAESLKYKDKEGYFNSLVSMCELPDRGFLVTDSRMGKIYFLKNESKKIDLFGDSLNLKQPTGIAYAKLKDEIWVLETKQHRIDILDNQGNLIKTIGKRGNNPGQFNFPTHIWIDDKGMAYIVDSMNFRVQIFNSEGEWVSMFGKAGDASGFFARPKGIATDSHGNIYVADALFHTIQIFNNNGELLYNFGSQGRESGDFWLPNGIYIDSNDYIYVADSYNSRVQVFQLINQD